MPPMNSSYIPVGNLPFFAPGYPAINNIGVLNRPPYGIYPGQPLHQQALQSIYIPTPNPYQIPNPHIYQMPPPHISYNHVPMAQPMEMYQSNRMPGIEVRKMAENFHAFNYDQSRAVVNKPYQ